MRYARSAATLLLLAACRGDKPPAAHGADSSIATAGAAAPAAGSCPRTGHWGECQIRARLDASGLAPQVTTESVGDLPDLGIKPMTFTLGRAGLAFYIFTDSMARHRAAATLDTMKFIPQAKPLTMRNEATLIQNDNALAILFSKNEHQRERTSDAITAGPPQP